MDMVYDDLIAAVFLSFVIERVLAVFFDITGLESRVKFDGPWTEINAPTFRGSSLKGIIAAAIAIVICVKGDINVITEILQNAGKPATGGLDAWFGEWMTGVFIAGGSQGSVKLFQDLLGFSKANRDIINKSKEAQELARKEQAVRDQKAAELERKRLESALTSVANEEKLLGYRVETNVKLAEIKRRQRLREAERHVAVDPKYLSSPADAYLKDVIGNWDEFVTLRAELRSEAANGNC